MSAVHVCFLHIWSETEELTFTFFKKEGSWGLLNYLFWFFGVDHNLSHAFYLLLYAFVQRN